MRLEIQAEQAMPMAKTAMSTRLNLRRSPMVHSL
jgi:hypothetical protein